MKELETKEKKEGIGGWLFVLCFLLIFVAPIRNIFIIYSEFSETSYYFNEIKGLENFVYIESISIIILMILSIWSGISLVLIKPYAVILTKIYLFLFLINGFLQNLLPQIVGLEEIFIKGMEHQMKVNTLSAFFVFAIWFSYLSLSERVKNTYQNTKLKENLNLEKQKYKGILDKIISLKNKFKYFFNNQILKRVQKIDIRNLNPDEIIITSIIIGTFIAMIMGYSFGTTYYFQENGRRGNEGYYFYEEFHFNYLLGIASFLIFAGISYIYLNRKSK